MNITNNPFLVTAPDTAVIELNIMDELPKPRPITTAFIEVTVGSFKFAVGSSTDINNSPTFSAGAKVPISFVDGEDPLYAKATTANDKFIISW